MATTTARGPGAIRFPPLTAILFGGVGSQVSQAQPLSVSLPGRGRFSVPALHVPKVILYTGVRDKLALRQSEDRLDAVDTGAAERTGEP